MFIVPHDEIISHSRQNYKSPSAKRRKMPLAKVEVPPAKLNLRFIHTITIIKDSN